MRFAFFAPASLIACAIGMYACSSDDSTTATPDAGKGTSTSSTSSSAGGDQTSTSSSSSGDNTSTSSSSSTTSSSGDGGGSTTSTSSTTGGPIPGADGGAGTKCEVGAIEELEPNNSAASPQAVAGDGKFNACGKIAPGEEDYYSFTYAAGSNGWGFSAQTTGAGIKVEGIVNGTTFAITGNAAGGGDDMPAQSATPTVIKVTNTGAAPFDYIIRFTKTP